MRKICTALLLVSLITFISCNPDGENPETGEVQLAFSKGVISNARTSDEDLTSLIISLESGSGELILDQEEIEITPFGDGYVSNPILLAIGDYSVTKFLVLGSTGEIVYATPLEGSALEGLVKDALPVFFEVTPDEITEVELEVIATSSYDPEDLGYTSLSFDIAPIQDILVTVFSQSESGSFSFTESDLSVYFDGDFAYSTPLGDSINVIPLRTDGEEILLKFVNLESVVEMVLLSSDTLSYYRTVPLVVIFHDDVDLGSDLVAYYPFNGNANDESGNALDGIVQGPDLTEDRNGIANSAYAYSGNKDVIVVDDHDLLDIVDSLTLSVWINLTSGNLNGSRLIDKGISGAGSGFLLDLYNLNSNVEQQNTIRFIGNEGFTSISEEEVDVMEWSHIAASYAGGQVKIYLNGILISVTQEEETLLTVHDGDLEIGNDLYGPGPKLYYPFRGSIDDIRIYSRTLNSKEIQALFNL